MNRGAHLCAVMLMAGLGPPLTAEDPPPAVNEETGMALVEAGEFTMGRTRQTSDDKTGMRPLILRDDRPPHAVYIDVFFLDVTEVTQGEYAKFAAATGRVPPYHWKGGGPPRGQANFPVYNVDWYDAQAYCEWAGKRLPTEAEWEKAARGELDGEDYPWGDGITPQDARFNTAAGPGPVGEFKPNAYGLFDMAGGVSEWCSDWFDRTYYERSPPRNPQGPETGMYKIVRGGSWADGPRRVTVFFRNWVRPNQKTPNIGFRCAKDAPGSPQ